ncbi:ribokinase [Roseobacter denitrificans]|uniref:Ribokinase n=1 Tax=Roseobacter denitrificans (strain ATCC 33942 / OCh 114) TaxID=375451 RepID=Q161Y6_ROSDO|nr:ribokinase [Roseobacter denitrificans]ABG33207.1 ribokinase [Roseobacter denitrificans OCh 114]AVL52556.1 ribokinase [Roseobacter denitrificans]SFG29904.1 6-phosphofructokinase [Roseobacter denitrificans OCh 114]
MGRVVILGVFVADTAYRADRMPRMGETIMGKSFALGPGGKGSNQAVASARLGAETHLISRLGQDDFGRLALETWRTAGVTPHAVQMADSYTGAAHIFIEESTGDNAIIIAPGAAAFISPQDVQAQAALIKGADVFVTQLEQPMDAAVKALEIARQASVTTVLNPAPAAPLPPGMLALCDYVTPNETETEALTGVAVTDAGSAQKACEALSEMGVGRPIITMGEQGAYLAGHGLVPAVNAGPVVETTGAGDAFNGAFAAALSEGMPVERAVQYGCATAGISVTRPGTAPAMPSRAEVEALL